MATATMPRTPAASSWTFPALPCTLILLLLLFFLTHFHCSNYGALTWNSQPLLSTGYDARVTPGNYPHDDDKCAGHLFLAMLVTNKRAP